MAVVSQDGIRADMRRGREEVRGLGEEVGGIAEDIRDLIRSEIELAKAEVREQLNLAVRSAIWGGVALVAASLGLVFIALTAMFALWVALPMWLSALIVTACLLALAATAGLMVRARIKQMTVVPRKTIDSLREDVQWAKAQVKSSAT